MRGKKTEVRSGLKGQKPLAQGNALGIKTGQRPGDKTGQRPGKIEKDKTNRKIMS
jgi:hypothetical protein